MASESPAPERVEATVLGICAEVLGWPEVDARDNFFILGGDSLQAAQLVSRLSHEVSRRVKVRMLFEFPVLADSPGKVAGAPATPARTASVNESMRRSSIRSVVAFTVPLKWRQWGRRV
jgi:acyl carrier protein